MLVVSLVFAANANAVAPSPVRQGLGLESALPNFTDEDLLSGIKYAVENSNINPIISIKVAAGKSETLVIAIHGNQKASQFVCSLKDKTSECISKNFFVERTTAVTEVPFGNIKDYGFRLQSEADGMGWTSWIAISMVSVYALKKLGNWWFTGSAWADADPHSHFFLTPEQMRGQFETNGKILERIKDKIADDLVVAAGPLIAAASCGHDDHHDHHHDHRHGNGPKSFYCEGISPETAKEAQKALKGGLTGFGVTLTRDLYTELVKPFYDVVWATIDPEMRKQLLTFADLVTRRMLEERGLIPGAVTIGAVSAAEAVWETFETYLMPAGHFACNIANVAILGIAASAYFTYQCMVDPNLKGASFTERIKAAARISKIQWRAGYGLKAKTNGLSPSERTALSMNIIFRLMERDLRSARNLEWMDKETSREFAKAMGEIKRDLNSLSLRAVSNPPEELEWNKWLQRLAELRSWFKVDPKVLQPASQPAADTCEKTIQAAAS